MEQSFGVHSIVHEIISKHVKEGSFCIDATAGRGNDTALLCRLVGDSGKVFAFDIQQQALNSTAQLLKQQQLFSRCELVLDSHINMAKYAQPNTVHFITFNLGWLPKGDHTISTKPETTVQAIGEALMLLSKNGRMTIAIYYGKDTGYAEKDAVISYLKNLDSKKYMVLLHQFLNRPNCPPLLALVLKRTET